MLSFQFQKIEVEKKNENFEKNWKFFKKLNEVEDVAIACCYVSLIFLMWERNISNGNTLTS